MATVTLINGNTSAISSLSKSPNKSSYSKGDSVKITANIRDGYRFDYWYRSETGATSTSNPMTFTMASADRTYTAYAYGITYYIEFDPNDGSGRYTSDQTMTYGTSASLKKNPFTRDGYTFLGWSRSSTATSATWSDGATVSNLTTVNGGIVCLYAVWEEKPTLTVQLTAGPYIASVSKSPNKSIYHVDDVVTISATLASKAGYTISFDRWERQGYPDQTKYDQSFSFTCYSADRIYTAYGKATPNAYTLSLVATYEGYDCIGSGTYNTDNSVYIGCSVSEGYHFYSWYCAAEGVNYSYNQYDYITMPPRDLSLMTITEANEYTVYFMPNGGDGNITLQSATYDVSFNLYTNQFVREDYQFVGWSLSSGGGKVYNDGELVSNLTSENGGVVYLYAVWELIPVTYSLSYDGNGGNNVPETQTAYTTDSPYDFTVSLLSPVRSGYKFVGWSVTKDGDTAYLPGDTVSLERHSATLVLYAIWEHYSVIYYGIVDLDGIKRWQPCLAYWVEKGQWILCESYGHDPNGQWELTGQ